MTKGGRVITYLPRLHDAMPPVWSFETLPVGVVAAVRLGWLVVARRCADAPLRRRITAVRRFAVRCSHLW